MSFHETILENLTLRNALVLFSVYILSKILWQVIYYRFFHPLRSFPGPFLGSVTRLWLGWHCYQQTELETIYALHQKYGPVLRITPTLLLVSDTTYLPKIYHRNADKSPHYVTGSFGTTESVFNMRGNKQHAQFRKLIAGPYSFTNVKKMEGLIDARLRHFFDRIKHLYADTGVALDLCDWSVFMAYDIVSELGFGREFGFVEAASDVGDLIKGFHDGMTAFGLLARFHPFTTWMKSTTIGQKLLVATPQDNSGIGVLMRYRDKLLDERLDDIENGKAVDRVDLLQQMLNARDEKGEPLDHDYIRAEILLVLLAGADTTGTTFQAMFYYIINTPGVYKQMMEEIDRVSAAGLLSEIPQFDEVEKHCPYYIACVRESMRLCPSAPNIFPRMVSAGGLEIEGKHVPAGTEITCNPWMVHRDKKFYGEDALEFKPERWLKDAAKTKQMLKYNFAFGYGTRVCLGKDIAMIELYKGPFEFFRRFEVKLVDQKRPGKFIVHGGVGFWEDMKITIKNRASHATKKA